MEFVLCERLNAEVLESLKNNLHSVVCNAIRVSKLHIWHFVKCWALIFATSQFQINMANENIVLCESTIKSSGDSIYFFSPAITFPFDKLSTATPTNLAQFGQQWFSYFPDVLHNKWNENDADFCKYFALGCQKFNRIGQIVVSISLPVHASERVSGKKCGKHECYKKKPRDEWCDGKSWKTMVFVNGRHEKEHKNSQRKIPHGTWIERWWISCMQFIRLWCLSTHKSIVYGKKAAWTTMTRGKSDVQWTIEQLKCL